MNIDHLEDLLANWRRVLLVCVGASITLLATAIADIPNGRNPYFPGWYAVWFILQLAAVTPAIVLVLGSQLRKLPLADRLNTVFSYFAVAWIALVSFGLKLASTIASSLALLTIFLCGTGVALGIVYLLLRRSCVKAPEAMFP